MLYPDKSTRNAFFYYFSLILSISGSIFLSIESFLKLKGKSLCETEACAVVGKYLTVNESLLIASGAIFFWIIALSIYLSRKNNRIIYFLYSLLFLSLSIDSVLIGFQFFSVQQKCAICIIVAIILLCVATTVSLSNRHYPLLLCFCFTWIGGFSVNKIIAIPEPSDAYVKMAFLKTDPLTATPPNFFATFVFSMRCSHCMEIVSILEEKYNTNQIWRFATIDTDYDSLMKVNEFIKEYKSPSNPFTLLKSIKTSNIIPAHNNIENVSSFHSKKALSYLSNSGVNVIPTIIVEKSKSQKSILIGKGEIINFINDATKSN